MDGTPSSGRRALDGWKQWLEPTTKAGRARRPPERNARTEFPYSHGAARCTRLRNTVWVRGPPDAKVHP